MPYMNEPSINSIYWSNMARHKHTTGLALAAAIAIAGFWLAPLATLPIMAGLCLAFILQP